MENCLKNYQSLVKELEANRSLTKRLNVKIEELRDKVKALEQEKISMADHLRNSFRENIKGNLSQDELDRCQSKARRIESDLDEAKQKYAAARSILDENRAAERSLAETRKVALFKFKRAAYKDALAKISDAEREKVYEAAALKRHLPGKGYEAALFDAFPMEPIEKSNLRWETFVKKYQIPD